MVVSVVVGSHTSAFASFTSEPNIKGIRICKCKSKSH